MVSQAGDWPWSSYRAMVGAEPAPVWLETDWVLGQFGEERAQARAGYAAFVRQGVGQPSVWDGLRHQVFLGSEPFVEHHCVAATTRSACAKCYAPSAGRSPSPWRTSRAATPTGARPWPGPFRPVSTPCRRLPMLSAYTTRPSVERCDDWKAARGCGLPTCPTRVCLIARPRFPLTLESPATPNRAWRSRQNPTLSASAVWVAVFTTFGRRKGERDGKVQENRRRAVCSIFWTAVRLTGLGMTADTRRPGGTAGPRARAGTSPTR